MDRRVVLANPFYLSISCVDCELFCTYTKDNDFYRSPFVFYGFGHSDK